MASPSKVIEILLHFYSSEKEKNKETNVPTPIY